MKFGDIVVNEWAGEINPSKVLMVLRVGVLFVDCLTLTGRRAQFHNSKDLRLTKVGEVDFSSWRELADKHANLPADSEIEVFTRVGNNPDDKRQSDGGSSEHS